MMRRQIPFLALLALPVTAQDAAELRTLHRAAARGEIARVCALLDEHPDWVNQADGDDETALHFAASHGRAAVVELLLDRGAKVDARSYNRFTPLHRAVMHGNVETVRRLLAAGPDVEARTSFDRTALQIAAERNAHALVKVLLDHGATYDLHTAACRGDAARIRELAGLPETQVKFATWKIAITRGHADVVSVLTEIPRAQEPGPMMMEVRLPLTFYGTEHPDVVRILVEGGVDPLERALKTLSRVTPEQSTVLHYAATRGHLQTIVYLLDGPLAGHDGVVDVRDKAGRTPLQRAAEAGHVEVMAALAARGADLASLDAEGRTTVHVAALAGQPAVIEWLVAQGARLDAEDAAGRTAVALTAARLPWDASKCVEQMRALEMLQRLGSPIGLHEAAVLGDAARLTALLARPEHEPTAFFAARAILFDRDEALAAFVDAGLDPNARHEHERTLLHVAVIRDAPRCAAWLLENGGDPTLKDAHGKLARQWLSARSSPELRAIVE